MIPLYKEIEDYILHTAWSTVSGSKDISGIGVFFEPKAFDPGIEDYTIYVSDSDAENKTCQSYGSYSDYGSKDYYTEAAKSKKQYLQTHMRIRELRWLRQHFQLYIKRKCRVW